MAERPVLIGLPYSPWSEKARWPLDVRGVEYDYRVYAPIIGEPMLRARLKKFSGPVSVPVLVDENGHAIADSTNIARWADERGSGMSLFPIEHAAEIDRFVALSEVGLQSGRALSLHRMLQDDEALKEMVPKAMRFAGPIASGIGSMGVKRTLQKYAADRENSLGRIEGVLGELRHALAAAPAGSSGPRTLFGRFTFADIAMSQILTFISPPKFGVRLGKASRRSFTDPVLSERYSDLIEWRNALYESHRPR